jgi:polyhydroxybutyrate depolymerase
MAADASSSSVGTSAAGAGGGSTQGTSGTAGHGGAAQGSPSASSSSSSGGSAGTGGSPAKGCGMAATPGLHDETIQSGGMARTFHVHVPTGYDASKPTMLVFVFHGLTQHGVGSDVFAIEYLSQMDPVSDAQGFLVVYPDGYDESWNAGLCCGGAVAAKVDDVGFFDDMLARLGSEYCVDPKRVYAAGLSNGGFFSNRLGCERASVVAAIGPVAGPLDISPCNPSRPVPMFEVHGTSDPVVYYNGGSASGADSVPTAVATWEKNDGCTDPMPATVYTNGSATCTEDTMCAGGSAVELCVIQGGGHQWPGGKDDYLGNFSTDLDTSTKMIEFFTAHPLP